jgi:surface polysaccharide O-acyltransferase-like enzyme
MNRIHSIDTLRSIAIVFVIAIHTNPFNGLSTSGNVFDFIVDATAGFAVPFFFVTSGYLFAMKVSKGGSVSYLIQYLRRLMSIYVFGILSFFIIDVFQLFILTIIRNEQFYEILFLRYADLINPVKLIYYGTAVGYHLWFLTALGFSILIIFICYRKSWIEYLLFISIILHVLGILVESYSSIIGVSWQARDGVFFGLFYTTVGFYIRRFDFKKYKNNHRFLIATAFFALLNVIERAWIGYTLGGANGPISEAVFTTNFSFFTIPFVLSLSFYALSTPHLGKGGFWCRSGKYTLGIYILHPVILKFINLLGGGFELILQSRITSTFLWHLLLTPSIYIITLLFYILLGEAGVIDIFYTYRGDKNSNYIPRIYK